MPAADPTIRFAHAGSRPDLHNNCALQATKLRQLAFVTHQNCVVEFPEMNGIIYLVGLVVVIMAILSFFGLR